MNLTFQKATRTKAKLRMALIGPPGSGKTYTALNIAQYLADDNQRIAVVDTEHGSASKYAAGQPFDFDVLELDTFSPDTYIAAIQAAAKARYGVLVIDSLSHAWIGAGGALEMVDNAARRMKGNSYVAWGDVTPIYRRMFDAILSADMHIIATMRSKTEYVLEQGSNGKTTPRKVGTAPQIRDGSEYEFDIVADLDIDHNLMVSKTRCPALDNAVIALPGQQVAEALRSWLEVGDVPSIKPAAPKSGGRDSDKGNATPHAAPKGAQNGDAPPAGENSSLQTESRWNDDKERVKKFAGWYAQQGLNHREALEALGVDQFSAYQGDERAAMAAITAYVNEHAAPADDAPVPWKDRKDLLRACVDKGYANAQKHALNILEKLTSEGKADERWKDEVVLVAVELYRKHRNEEDMATIEAELDRYADEVMTDLAELGGEVTQAPLLDAPAHDTTYAE